MITKECDAGESVIERHLYDKLSMASISVLLRAVDPSRSQSRKDSTRGEIPRRARLRQRRGRRRNRDTMPTSGRFKELWSMRCSMTSKPRHVTRRHPWQGGGAITRCSIVHYPHPARCSRACIIYYARLKAELEEHFAKEEKLVFPLMRHPHPDFKAARARAGAARRSTAARETSSRRSGTDRPAHARRPPPDLPPFHRHGPAL